jgi:putative tricarboxylic transport membrane protein
MATQSKKPLRCSSVAVMAGLLLVAVPALALDSVKFLVPANPGGGWDQTARSLQAAMQKENIVKNVTVENKGGAGGSIGLAQFVNSSKGDGSALLVAGAVMVGALITNQSPVKLSQVTPIARLTGEYEVIVVPADSKIKTMKELVEQLKKNPGSVSWGGGSKGGVDHILAALIAQDAGVDPAKVNYIAYSGGGEALAAIVGGHVTAGVSGYGEFEGQIKAGKLRALAVSSEKRLPGIDVPTLKEQGINVELGNWRAVFGGPGLNDAQRKELTATLDKTVKSKAWQETLAQKNWTNLYLTGDAFAKFIAAEDARIGKIIERLGMAK